MKKHYSAYPVAPYQEVNLEARKLSFCIGAVFVFAVLFFFINLWSRPNLIDYKCKYALKQKLSICKGLPIFIRGLCVPFSTNSYMNVRIGSSKLHATLFSLSKHVKMIIN